MIKKRTVITEEYLKDATDLANNMKNFYKARAEGHEFEENEMQFDHNTELGNFLRDQKLNINRQILSHQMPEVNNKIINATSEDEIHKLTSDYKRDMEVQRMSFERSKDKGSERVIHTEIPTFEFSESSNVSHKGIPLLERVNKYDEHKERRSNRSKDEKKKRRVKVVTTYEYDYSE